MSWVSWKGRFGTRREEENLGKGNLRSKAKQLPGLSLQHLCALRHPQDNVRRSETSVIFRNLGVFIDFRRVIDDPQICNFAHSSIQTQ